MEIKLCFDSEKEARAFVAGVEYVNDSAIRIISIKDTVVTLEDEEG